MKLTLLCDICREVIGKFDPEDLAIPLKAEMFEPKDDIHELPPPFRAGAEWEHIYCPMSKEPRLHRPFPPDKVLTDKGYYEIGSDKIPGYVFNPNVETYADEDLEEEWNKRTKAEDPIEQGDPETFKCEECGKEYTLLRNLNRHIRQAHP